MRRTLLFTTMTNHRYSKSESGSDSEVRNLEEPRQFQITHARDPMDTNHMNPRNAPQRTLSELLARSTQPIFSVSAMFRMNPNGGGCGACGH